MSTYPKRLIEIDLPIARVSEHARREKSIRHGHISTLHIWWARRPLAACRAVICASLWPDPEDLTVWLNEAEARQESVAPASSRSEWGPEIRAPRGCKPDEGVTIRPRRFLDEAHRQMLHWATHHANKCSNESMARLVAGQKEPSVLDDPVELRRVLLDFIADFANWDNSTDAAFLETARALTQAAHEALGGLPAGQAGEAGTRPLLVDPFAGGGSIPLEALRVGADAFASDLNPVAVLLNKVVLEYIPKHGRRLADEVRKWGQWVKEQAEKELAEFYPKDPDGATPIAYLWARTILSEGPGAGEIPVEVPLMRSLWLAKRTGRKRALRWVRDAQGKVKTKTIEVTHVCGTGLPARDGEHGLEGRATIKVKRPLLEIFEPANDSEVEGGTVARGSATCPVTGFTTKVDSVRAQLKQRRGGAADARLFAVVTTRDQEQGRFYRLPTAADQAAFDTAAAELERRESWRGASSPRRERDTRPGRPCHVGERSAAAGAEGAENRRSLVPDEIISLNELRRISVPIYGMERWGDLFSPRQALALTTLARLVRELPKRRGASDDPDGLAEAVATCLAFALSKGTDLTNALCTWKPGAECPVHLFARQAVPFVWEFAEAVATCEASGSFASMVERTCHAIEMAICRFDAPGHVEQASATAHPLPDDSAAALVTDPPYYDAVPYAYLSDFFYVWLRRTLADVHPPLFGEAGVPKDAEIVVDRPHKLSKSTKGIAFYERELTRAFAEGRRVLAPSGVGTIVFASKTTASWEAILKAVIDAGFVVTGSWPIDTEMATRVAAQGQARLASSVHIVCRPRENPDGSLREEVGEWREVLAELPKRIHAWMPRLAAEGVVGADAIFACLGPALEVFSRYSRVEKASGEVVTLGEYLEQVWAAVSREALSMLFEEAEATTLEPDARLTAMWLWTCLALPAGRQGGRQALGAGTRPTAEHAEGRREKDKGEDEDNEKQTSAPLRALGGYVLEYDAARKIAQGLGAHLDKLESIVEVQGDKARLLSVAERTRHLFGKDERGRVNAGGRRRKKKEAQQRFDFAAELEAAEQAAEAGGSPVGGPPLGRTVLDRVHQAMILFGAGRGEALKRFLVEDLPTGQAGGAGTDARFWRLAQSLSALYPTGSDEKRWIDGVLGRKKGLGL